MGLVSWIEAAPFVSLILAITLLIWVTARAGRRGRRPSRTLFMVVLSRQRLIPPREHGDDEDDEPEPADGSDH